MKEIIRKVLAKATFHTTKQSVGTANDIMTLVLSHLDTVDYLETDIPTLLSYIFKDSARENTTLVIDRGTDIISFPFQKKKVDSLYESIRTYGFEEESLLGSDRFLYVKELNLLTMNEGASHRLAAIYKYVKEDGGSIELSSTSVLSKEVNKELLHTFVFDKKNGRIIIPSHSHFKAYYTVPEEVLDYLYNLKGIVEAK